MLLSKITRQSPMRGLCAETGGAITPFLATALGVPLSITDTIKGPIFGVVGGEPHVGCTLEHRARIVVARVLTLPASVGIAGEPKA